MSELHRRWRWFLGLFNGQAYYWTREWQQGVREFEAERAAGRLLTFSSWSDLERWLTEPTYGVTNRQSYVALLNVPNTCGNGVPRSPQRTPDVRTLPAPGWLELFPTILTQWDCHSCGERFGVFEAYVPVDSTLEGPGESPVRRWQLSVRDVRDIRCPSCGESVQAWPQQSPVRPVASPGEPQT